MSKHTKFLLKILSGRSDSNISFAELTQLLIRLKFDTRIRGDHHIFTRNDVNEILNLQPQNAMAKAYQVKQVRNLLIQYQLVGDLINE
jgi:hypothetical protein